MNNCDLNEDTIPEFASPTRLLPLSLANGLQAAKKEKQDFHPGKLVNEPGTS